MGAWFRDLMRLCREEKKWLLASLLVLVLLAGAAVMLLASNSGISWALYPSR